MPFLKKSTVMGIAPPKERVTISSCPSIGTAVYSAPTARRKRQCDAVVPAAKQKTNQLTNPHSMTTEPLSKHHPRIPALRGLRGLLGLGFLLIPLLPSQGGDFHWDPTSVSAAADGSGNWADPNVWWTGTATSSWVSGSNAVIGAGVAGNYTINLGTTAETVTNLNFVSAGTYVLTG